MVDLTTPKEDLQDDLTLLTDVRRANPRAPIVLLTNKIDLVTTDLTDRLDELCKAANLKPLSDGVIRFECGGELITIEPRDEVIRIKKIKQVAVNEPKK